MFSSQLFLLLAISLPSLALGASIFDHGKLQEITCQHSDPQTLCANFGSKDETIGPFRPDELIVTYGIITPRPNRRKRNVPGAHGRAYSIQRVDKYGITFHIRLNDLNTYDLTFGFAELSHCGSPGNELTIKVGRDELERIITVNPFSQKGCRRSFTTKMTTVIPDKWGRVFVEITGTKEASIATLCIKENSKPLPTCKSRNCISSRGKVSSVIATSSFHIDNDPWRGCGIRSKSAINLNVPHSATVLRAYVQWAAMGAPSNPSVSLTVNGKNVLADVFHELTEDMYTATADITSIVSARKDGTYTASGMLYDETLDCPQSDIAVWSIIAIYKEDSLPFSHINACFQQFASSRSTANAPTIEIDCMYPSHTGGKATLTVIGYEGESVAQNVTVNGQLMVDFKFPGKTAQRTDVVATDVTKLVRGGSKKLVISIGNQKGKFDGIFIPFGMTKQIL